MTEPIRHALRRAAAALRLFDVASVEQAEAALQEALESARTALAAGALTPSNWPTADLAVCREMTHNHSLIWERRRAARTVAAERAESPFVMA